LRHYTDGCTNASPRNHRHSGHPIGLRLETLCEVKGHCVSAVHHALGTLITPEHCVQSILAPRSVKVGASAHLGKKFSDQP